MARPKWIIANQQKEVLRQYTGRVVWVNQCLRCGSEEPVYEGLLETTLSQSIQFIRQHQKCGGPRANR